MNKAILPTKQLIEKYNLSIYLELSNTIKTGDLSLFNKHVENNYI